MPVAASLKMRGSREGKLQAVAYLSNHQIPRLSKTLIIQSPRIQHGKTHTVLDLGIPKARSPLVRYSAAKVRGKPRPLLLFSRTPRRIAHPICSCLSQNQHSLKAETDSLTRYQL